MEPKHAKASPPSSSGSAAKVQNPSASNETPKNVQKPEKTKSTRRKVIRPTEIEPPPEAPKKPSRNETQATDIVNDDDADSLDPSSSEDDVRCTHIPEGGKGMDGEDSYDEDDYDEDEDDEIESIYLSDPDEPKDSRSKAVKKSRVQSRQAASPHHPRNRNSNDNVPARPQHTLVQTRTETSHWVVAHQQSPASRNVAVTRGASTSRQQTVHQQFQNTDTTASDGRGLARGNSLRLNMSFNLNVNFSGLVTGRNLSLAGGQLSYSWARSQHN